MIQGFRKPLPLAGLLVCESQGSRSKGDLGLRGSFGGGGFSSDDSIQMAYWGAPREDSLLY